MSEVPVEQESPSLLSQLIEGGLPSLQAVFAQGINALQQPATYMQLALLVVIVVLAGLLVRPLRSLISRPLLHRFAPLSVFLRGFESVLLPILIYVMLSLGIGFSQSFSGESWLIKAAQGLALAILLWTALKRFVEPGFVRTFLLWTLVPMALLQAVGLLDGVQQILAAWTLNLGNITISTLGILRASIVGCFFYWLGKRSNSIGQKAIRDQQQIDLGTRELLAKLFELILFSVLFILLLQVAGINLTALTVFGGALGVGLGFGLQQIASNFISGMIILFDRSITVGDHIELEDGTFGILREIKLRYAVIETYEGKEVMVPNETFVTTAFTNWSHTDDKQRYDFTFSVSYETDLNALFPIVKEVVASHPQVISGDDAAPEELPDAEIESFGESGINILVEFWMHGIDDGKNRVDADLKLMVWQALKDNNFRMPFPQREVRILNPS